MTKTMATRARPVIAELALSQRSAIAVLRPGGRNHIATRQIARSALPRAGTIEWSELML
jgi:hypothetical protein